MCWYWILCGEYKRRRGSVDAESALLNHERGIPVQTGFSRDYQAIYFENHNYLVFFTVVPIRISDSSIYREPTVVCASFHAG
jgi:hypothetical protein